MSQIGLKDTELIKLKQWIEELEKERVQEKQGRESVEEKCRELTQQNGKLSQQVTEKLALQGVKHLIWDRIIMEADRFRPYLNVITDLGSTVEETKKQVQEVGDEVNKRTLEIAKRAITYLSSLLDEASNIFSLQNQVVVISGARRVKTKHRMMETVQAQIDVTDHKLREILRMLKTLVSRGLPFF